MAEKDLVEKILLDHEDVFADICNTVLFDGIQRVNPKDLVNTSVHSMYKASDDRLHEEERDVAKLWKVSNVKIVMYCGFENQTDVFTQMPVRVIGYDGTAYRSELMQYNALLNRERVAKRKYDSNNDKYEKEYAEAVKNRKSFVFYPVITVVLYFGTSHRWNGPKSLKELLDIPDWLDGYVQDYKINVIEVAWLPENVRQKFKSDFGIVADFFYNKRINPAYVPDDKRIISHVDEMLKLLSVFTGDKEYVQSISKMSPAEKKGATMCSVAQNLINKGIEQGLSQGISQGLSQGISQGISQGRTQGIREHSITVYNNCISRGMSEDDAIALSGISEEDLRSLKNG